MCAPVHLVAPVNAPTSDVKLKAFSNTIYLLHKTTTHELQVVLLDLDIARLVRYMNALFSNAKGVKFQLGYVLLIYHAKAKYTVIRYGSNICRWITRSVMAAYVQTLVREYYNAYLVADLVEELLGRPCTKESGHIQKQSVQLDIRRCAAHEKPLQNTFSPPKTELPLRRGKPGVVDTRHRQPVELADESCTVKYSPMHRRVVTNSFQPSPKGWKTSREGNYLIIHNPYYSICAKTQENDKRARRKDEEKRIRVRRDDGSKKDRWSVSSVAQAAELSTLHS